MNRRCIKFPYGVIVFITMVIIGELLYCGIEVPKKVRRKLTRKNSGKLYDIPLGNRGSRKKPQAGSEPP
jgi:hypothetical protein